MKYSNWAYNKTLKTYPWLRCWRASLFPYCQRQQKQRRQQFYQYTMSTSVVIPRNSLTQQPSELPTLPIQQQQLQLRQNHQINDATIVTCVSHKNKLNVQSNWKTESSPALPWLRLWASASLSAVRAADSLLQLHALHSVNWATCSYPFHLVGVLIGCVHCVVFFWQLFLCTYISILIYSIVKIRSPKLSKCSWQ